MRFSPIACPECGEPARGTAEVLYGRANFVYPGDLDDESSAEEIQAAINAGAVLDHDGETKIFWDAQQTVLDDEGLVTLLCCNGHEWGAVDLDDEPTQPPGPPTPRAQMPIGRFRGMTLDGE